jgi:hypothetical protein
MSIVFPTTTSARHEHPREFRRGDTIQIPLYVVDRETDGVVDIAGWTFWFTAKVAVPLPDQQAQIAQDNIGPGGNGGITITDAAAGELLVQVQPIVTRAYPDGPVLLDYDVQAQDPLGVITTLETRKMIVLPDITRAIGS